MILTKVVMTIFHEKLRKNAIFVIQRDSDDKRWLQKAGFKIYRL